MDSQNKTSNNNPDSKVLIATLLLPGGLILFYLSLAFYTLSWRVSNEPGFSTAWELLIPAIGFCGMGGLIFLGSNIYLFMRRTKLIFLAWALCIPVTIGAASLAPILVLFMV